jgi:signal transduction histidine kinase
MAILMLSVSLGFGFRHILIRIKRLESDVNIVSHINMNHQIVCEGEDEIGFLSRNVENMRITILENLEKERDARDANTELITAMSHDIRTPLTVLLGYIDMLKNYDGCDETVRSYVAATERTAQRLKELSDDMFKYSLAFTDPERETEITEYEAKMLFDQLLSEHVLLLSESGYTVNMGNELSLIDDNATVYTDPQNLMRVIDNIFQNIYKYADKEKPVDISIKCDRKEITFCFRNGIQRDPTEAESNRIGLKTCERLCRFIASEFSYENDGEYFTVKLRLSFGKPNKNRIKIDKE